jgi:hypothetical protein
MHAGTLRHPPGWQRDACSLAGDWVVLLTRKPAIHYCWFDANWEQVGCSGTLLSALNPVTATSHFSEDIVPPTGLV